MNRSVTIIGWSTLAVSVLVICVDLFSLVLSASNDQLVALLNSFPQFKNGTTDAMSALFQYNRIWTLYTILYFAVTLAGAVLFVQYRSLGRKILESVCWVGLLNAVIDSVAGYVFWTEMETMISGLAGGIGMPLRQLNPLGLGTIVLGFLLWVIPSVGMIAYLRRPSLKALMKP